MNKRTPRANRQSRVSGKKRLPGLQQKRPDAEGRSAFLRKPLVWLGGLATAILTGVLISILTGPTQSIFKSSPTASPLPKLPAPQQDLCSKYHIDVQCTFNVLDPGSYVTKKPFSSYQKIPGCNSPIMNSWINENTYPYKNTFVLEISSSTRAPVDIANLQASIVKQYPPLGTAILECAGGQTYSLYVQVNLDTNPPSVKYYCGTTLCAFPTFTLQKGDAIKIYIDAYSTKHLTEWRGRYNLIVNGREYALDLGYHYVSSESAATGATGYCPISETTWQRC